VGAVVHLAASALAPVEQDHLDQARQMQALSFTAHIPLVCFAIGFPTFVLIAEALYLRTGDPLYRTLAKRWSKVMIALFAVGVVTGTILSFELGLLWPRFMATFGGVFGLAFALEGFSFFVEAIFIAIYVYGWDRISPRRHFLLGVPVAIAGLSGSLFVISVNGFMQHPTGFRLENGRAVGVHPFHALFGNSFFWHEFVHMYIAGFLVAGFLVAAVYAAGFLRGNTSRFHRTALLIPLTVAAVAAPAQLIVGDWAAREVARDQPIKLASFEGLTKTTKGADLHILGWYEDGKVKGGIAFPKLLSFLTDHDFNSTVQGLDTVPADDRPPQINVIRYSFETMVGIGLFLAALGVFHLYSWLRRRRLVLSPWFLRALVAAGPLSVVALIAGWVTTEVGRQPYVVYRFMRTEDAVTGAGGIPVGYTTLVVVYAGLAFAVWWLLRRIAGTAIEGDAKAEQHA
jgi:cytochrome bd ubiquinol oxidase subunit I